MLLEYILVLLLNNDLLNNLLNVNPFPNIPRMSSLIDGDIKARSILLVSYRQNCPTHNVVSKLLEKSELLVSFYCF